ncbi:hypothetical protein BLA24_00465 [Streptomyces cinnamoneus]|uniref:Uncharacterized protein n=1 Tax=Streptomyces cinnamoneus TaxID=53446 RepID=A0A2G1XQE2_STRCJ|nr:hypothetical protein [Streptomyces cinnamoneus]PHQ53442.1 hypothetical protein BLA24_00465 [Streptomyces cinnamoneus]PPT12747.1 hypothetical protein CYQ11_07475 [Streptomyces cinnamoneus]
MNAAPEAGTWVVDVRRDRVGEVVEVSDGRVSLRDLTSREEWEASPCDVRPATANDELRAKVADLNHRSVRRQAR